METITEWCLHCCGEVELKAEVCKQTCPSCKEEILPCSMCDMDNVKCEACPA